MDNKFEWNRTVVGSDGSSATEQCSAEGDFLIFVGVTLAIAFAGACVGGALYQIKKDGWSWKLLG